MQMCVLGHNYTQALHSCSLTWTQFLAGSALLFFDMDIAGSKGDRRALHASCPTLQGTKVSALGGVAFNATHLT